MKGFLSRFGKDIAIDLGTAQTYIYVRDRGIVVNEPSIVAFNAKTDQVIAVGHDAKNMMGKTPGYITASSPLLRGIISDFELTEKLLKHFMERIETRGMFNIIPRSRMMFGVPLEITEVERKAVEDIAYSIGAREVQLVQQTIASAVGLRLPIEDPVGNLIVDFGAGTTEIAVISLGGVVAWKSVRIAGNQMNNDIVEYARHEYNILLGENAAESLKIHIGTAVEPETELTMSVRGRDIISGLPKEVIFNDYQVRSALLRSLKLIVDDIKATLEVTPPELVADIYQHGLILTGGGSQLSGLDTYISSALRIPVRIAEDPSTTVVRGLGLLLEESETAREFILPSTHDGHPIR